MKNFIAGGILILLLTGCGNVIEKNYKYKIQHKKPKFIEMGFIETYYTNTNDIFLNEGFVTFLNIKDDKIYSLSGNLIIEHAGGK